MPDSKAFAPCLSLPVQAAYLAIHHHYAATAMAAEPFNWEPADWTITDPPTLLISCSELRVVDADATLGKRTADGYRMGVSQHLLGVGILACMLWWWVLSVLCLQLLSPQVTAGATCTAQAVALRAHGICSVAPGGWIHPA